MKLFFTGAAVLSIVISLAIILSLVGNALTFFISVDQGKPCGPTAGFPAAGCSTSRRSWSARWSSRRSRCSWRRRWAWAPRSTSRSTPRRGPPLLKPILEILAAIPSVVLGFFALTLISPNVVQPLTDAPLVQHGGRRHRGRHPVTPLIASVSRTRCTRCRPISARRPTGSGARRRPPPCRSSCRRRLGDRGGPHHRRLARDRRDDDRGHRRGRHRRRCSSSNPWSRADHDRRR